MRTWTLAILLLASATAGAEGRFTLPLPDPGLPDGALTVKVVGSDLRDVRTGQKVELVKADGASVATATTGEDGRARFDGLAAGERYVVRVAVDGQELRSEPFPGTAAGGTRLLLSIGGEVKMGGAAPPTGGGGLPPGHPPTPAATEEGASGAAQLAPDAELGPKQLRVVVLKGRALRPLAGARVSLVEEGATPRELPHTDAQGQTLAAIVEGKRYRVQVGHGGMTYASRALTVPAGARQGTRATFQVFDRTSDTSKLILGDGSHWVAQIGEGVVRFMQVMRLDTTADAIVDPGEAGLELPLPAGARNLELPDELQGLVEADAAHNAVRLRAPVPPGGLPLRVFFEVPFDSATLELRQPMPLSLPGPTGVLLVNATRRVQVGGPAVDGKGQLTERGMSFKVAGVKAGGQLELTFDNLPHRDNRQLIAVLALAGLIALWAIFAGAAGPQRAESRRARKEKLLTQLVQARRSQKGKGKRAGPGHQAELIQELRQLWEEPW